jgi:DNA-binding CsgD family transcriptional regulator
LAGIVERAAVPDMQETKVRGPLAFGVLDARWRVRRVSQDIVKLLGYEPAECVGVGALMAVHPDDLSTVLINLGDALGDRTTAYMQVRLSHKESGWASTTLVISPLSPERPYPIGFVVAAASNGFQDDVGLRLMSAEMRLRRIAAELQLAGVVNASEPRDMPHARGRQVPPNLSQRQAQVLERILQGKRVGTIANEFGVSPSTVRNHLSVLFRKLGVASQEELIEAFRGEAIA